MSPEGKVISDLASITQLNWRALPVRVMRSVYLLVSSRVMKGLSPILRRLSHLTLMLPSQPGRISRMG